MSLWINADPKSEEIQVSQVKVTEEKVAQEKVRREKAGQVGQKGQTEPEEVEDDGGGGPEDPPVPPPVPLGAYDWIKKYLEEGNGKVIPHTYLFDPIRKGEGQCVISYVEANKDRIVIQITVDHLLKWIEQK